MLQTFRFVGNKEIADKLSNHLVKAGFQLVDSEEADVIFTYCDSLSALEDLYFDSEGLIHTASKQACFIDLSPSTPNFARELYAVAAVSELQVIEAPLVVKDITSEQVFYDSSKLLCYVAGDEVVIDKHKGMLDALVGSWKSLGEAGSAQLARCVYTLQTAASLVSMVEAYVLASATKDIQRVDVSNLMSRMLVGEDGYVKTARGLLERITSKNFSGDYTVQMCAAELAAALMAADDASIILPGAEAAMHLLEILVVIGGADMSPAALSLIYGDEAGSSEQGLDWSRIEDVFEQDGCLDDEDEEYYGDTDFPQSYNTYSDN